MAPTFAWLDKIKISAARAAYRHDELNDGKFYTDPNYPEAEQRRRAETAAQCKGRPDTVFANKGLNSRIEFYHAPIAGWLKGVFGAQYQTQKSSAVRLMEDRDVEKNRFALVPNTNKQLGLFALEQLKLGSLTLEAGARWERQRISVGYDRDALENFIKRRESRFRRSVRPDLRDYRESSFSYSGTALWDFHPDYRLSLTASHNERLPAPMELYYHGKHLATNSFEHGNKALKKERSNNFEIGIAHHGSRLHYKISAYHNRFANYIHNENLHRSGNLFIRRDNQAAARFSGIEGEIGFHITPKHEFTLFGDYVKGSLKMDKPVSGCPKLPRYTTRHTSPSSRPTLPAPWFRRRATNTARFHSGQNRRDTRIRSISAAGERRFAMGFPANLPFAEKCGSGGADFANLRRGKSLRAMCFRLNGSKRQPENAR